MNFGKNLRHFRKRMGWSQRQLAEAMTARGVRTSTSWVGWAEKNLTSSPKHAILLAAADVLGVTNEQLLGPEEPESEALVIRLRLKPGMRISDAKRKQAERIMLAVLEELSKGHGDEQKKGRD